MSKDYRKAWPPKLPRLWCRLFHEIARWPYGLHCWHWRCIYCGREGWFSDD